jgi:DNA polymerase I
MTILILDGHNLMHRARSGFQLGDANVVYNFFRGLKPLVEKFAPSRVYFTLEGHPKKRYALLPTYKANRLVERVTAADEQKHKSLEDFRRQMHIIVELLATRFPVSVVQHPDFEADDVVYNLIDHASRAMEFTVVSTDTDFIQLLQEFSNVKLYNPVTKQLVEAPAYDYVQWKALRGDPSDNVPGIPGISDAKAVKLLANRWDAATFLNDPQQMEHWRQNCELIRLAKWDDEETKQMVSSTPTKDWSEVEQLFATMGFQSMLKEPYWSKFQATFNTLWG